MGYFTNGTLQLTYLPSVDGIKLRHRIIIRMHPMLQIISVLENSGHYLKKIVVIDDSNVEKIK